MTTDEEGTWYYPESPRVPKDPNDDSEWDIITYIGAFIVGIVGTTILVISFGYLAWKFG